MATAKVALRPKIEAPRRSGKTKRGTTNYIGNSSTVDTASTLRLQRLASLGVGGSSAILLASLIWGADGGNVLIGGVA